MASNKSSINSDINSDSEGNELEPPYDDLACAVEKLGALVDKRNKKIKKHDVLIESLHAEIARLKTLIPDDDSGKSCELVYAELTSLRNVHASTLEQFKAEKDKNEKHVCAAIEPTSCDKCELFKLKLKDADVRIAQLKDNFAIHAVPSCSNCGKQDKSKNDACENCATLLKCIDYLQGNMGTKVLNQILEQKTSTNKSGLGFNHYAHSKTHAPNVVKPLGIGKFEIANEPKKMVFKSAGIMSSSVQVNANVACTSQVKHKVKYTCTHCVVKMGI